MRWLPHVLYRGRRLSGGNVGKLGCLVAGALTVAVGATPSSARHKAVTPQPPVAAYNFVGLDLSASAPGASNAPRMAVTLLDTASAARLGDTVTFDVLTISKSFGHYMQGTKEIGPPEGTIMHGSSTYAASCNWRTIRLVSVTPNFWGAGQEMPVRLLSANQQNAFLGPGSPYLPVIDRLCGNTPLNAAKGYASVDAAVTAWSTTFAGGPHGPFAPPVPATVRPAAPFAMDGIDATKPHRFVRIETDTATGNVRYLDRGTLARDASHVTALTFSLLGPEAQNWNNGGVAVLQVVNYDCDAHTMTVVRQSDFDRFETLRSTADLPFAPRSVDATAQIAAACATGDDNQGLSSTEAVWTATQSEWPARPESVWAACLWNNLPAVRRQTYTDHWTGDVGDRFFVQQSEVPAVFAGCNIPDVHQDDALHSVQQFAMQRAAVARLAARKLDEPALIAAWRALPNADRRRVVRAAHTLNMDDIKFEVGVLVALATRLGVTASDIEGNKWLNAYFTSETFLEGA